MVGYVDGDIDGVLVGCSVSADGFVVGDMVGIYVGEIVGMFDGVSIGSMNTAVGLSERYRRLLRCHSWSYRW